MSSMNFNCDVCGREVFGCTFVNGMKFCAKCYQETFGETDKDRKIADLEAKLAEKDKENATLEAMLAENANDRKAMQEFKIGEDEYDLTDEDARNSLCWEVEELKQQLEEKDKEIETLKAKLETAEYWNKKYDDCQQQLELTEKALKLAREYMFNVMCADDVPFESWFIECAKNNWKPS